jgi:transcriptional regulator with XRE-family HTH domain
VGRIVLPSNRIASLRTASGLSRPDVAARLGLKSERTVYRWETGQSGIPDSSKFALADLFGVSVPWLMGWENENGDGDGGREVKAA